jgi:hypothetical protein
MGYPSSPEGRLPPGSEPIDRGVRRELHRYSWHYTWEAAPTAQRFSPMGSALSDVRRRDRGAALTSARTSDRAVGLNRVGVIYGCGMSRTCGGTSVDRARSFDGALRMAVEPGRFSAECAARVVIDGSSVSCRGYETQRCHEERVALRLEAGIPLPLTTSRS